MKEIYLGSNMDRYVVAVVKLKAKKIEAVFDMGPMNLGINFYTKDIDQICKIYDLKRVPLNKFPVFAYRHEKTFYDFDGYTEETSNEDIVLVDFTGHVDFERWKEKLNT